MDLPFVVRQRMVELSFEQKDLAAAAEVTESYISQLLTRKKAPPAPDRTDIYSKLERCLKLPKGRLSKLATLQRNEELKRKVVDPPAPLFKEVRDLILRKCASDKVDRVRGAFEKQPFGEFERLVTKTLLDVVQTLAKEELGNEEWLQRFAQLRDRRYDEVRVSILEFLDTDVFHVSDENCISFLEPLIEFWDMDFATFGMTVALNRRLGPGKPKRFEYVELSSDAPDKTEPGLLDFLDDSTLSHGVTEDEMAFLRRLTFNRARPTALYFYREVQNLRDPLHFDHPSSPGTSPSTHVTKRKRRKRVARKRKVGSV